MVSLDPRSRLPRAFSEESKTETVPPEATLCGGHMAVLRLWARLS